MTIATSFAAVSVPLACQPSERGVTFAEAAGGVPVSVSDSSGIRIVEYEHWTFAAEGRPATLEEPVFRAGHSSVDPAQARQGPPGFHANESFLYQVRGAAKLSSGTIVVANEGTAELMFFGADGSLIRTAGGRGQGPGEFRRLSRIAIAPGDTILVQDVADGRVSLLDADGTLLNDLRIDVADLSGIALSGLRMVHAPSATTLVATAVERAGGAIPWGTSRDELVVLRYDRSSEQWTRLARLKDTERHVQPGPQGGARILLRVPFGRVGIVRSGGGRLLVADSERWEFRIFSEDGTRLEMILRSPSVPPRLDPGMVDPSLRDVVVSDRIPGFEDAWLDARGRVWIERFEEPRSQRTMDVFDRDGLFERTVRLPLELELLEIGDDYVLGRERGDFDVEYVVEYPLNREGDI